jgi:hypothetical protein
MQPLSDDWRIELETHLPLDGRAELAGRLIPAEGDETPTWPAALAVTPVEATAPALSVAVSAAGDFVIPLQKLPPGYHRLAAEGEGAAADLFAVRGVRPPGEAAAGTADYLGFVRDTVDLLRERQSCHFGGDPAAPLALTISKPLHRSYRSLGHCTEGTFQTYWFPEYPLELTPLLLDFELWPVLQRLSSLTGEPQYAAWVDDMAAGFARHGFHPDSGLGFLGEEGGFDVLRLTGAPTKINNAEPLFKPKNSGHFPGLPLEVLWRHAPEQMHRMFRSMYYGLITDPQSMDFNRFCSYEYRDADRRHLMERNPGHCAFETAAARMIHWWCSAYRHTGDTDCLDYAGRMLEKWEAIQHPATGLVPNFFGAVGWQPGAPMPPGEWAELRGTALMAVALLEAAEELRQAPDDGGLSARLTTLAERAALGTARHGYDTRDHLYVEILHLDGRPYERTARYVFLTQEEKDAAVREHPELERVRVYRGTGLYRHQSYWEFYVGSRIPLHLAQVAEATGNRELLERLLPVAADALTEARETTEPFVAEGAWTFRASAICVKLLLSLWRQTGDQDHLQGAREIADRELSRLARVQAPDWWRQGERVALLEALLELHEALASRGLRRPQLI